MAVNPTSLAAAVAVGAKNVQFVPGIENIPRKLLIIGTYDPTKILVVDNELRQIFSAADAGAQFGAGFMAHRLARQTFNKWEGETWVCPQPETGTAGVGNVDFAGSAAVKAGYLYLFISGDPIYILITDGLTAEQIATAVVSTITNNFANASVTAEVDGSILTQVNFTAKSKGEWGNKITILFNALPSQSLPDGVVAVVTDMAGGVGIPDIGDALSALGEDDFANEQGFTEVVHGYGLDTVTLDKISNYVGPGNDFVGLYSKTVARPFRSLNGNTDPGTAGFSDLRIFTAGRKLDRASGVVAAPGSINHPAEIAALAIGALSKISSIRVAQSYIGDLLYGIFPGERADQWTADYDNRDLAYKSGISPTRIQNGVVALQNVATFYRPDNVSVTSNGWRSIRNIAIIQNILKNLRQNFEQEKWLGIFIVADTTSVTSFTDRQKARDIDAVIDDLAALANLFAGKGWLYEAEHTIDGLRQPGNIQIRPGGTGFDGIFPILLSGEGGIYNIEAQFDVSLPINAVTAA